MNDDKPRSAPPPEGGRCLNPRHAAAGALLFAALGAVLLLVDRYGLPYVLACCCFMAAAMAALGALVIAAKNATRNRNAR